MLGVVLELFVLEENLLAGCKYKFLAALAALQNSSVNSMAGFPKTGTCIRIGHDFKRLPVPFPCPVHHQQQGPGPPTKAANKSSTQQLGRLISL